MRPSTMAFVFALSLAWRFSFSRPLPRPTHPTSSRSERWPLTSQSRAPHATESSRTRSACRIYGERWWYWRFSSEHERVAEQFKWKRTVISTQEFSEAARRNGPRHQQRLCGGFGVMGRGRRFPGPLR